MSAPETTVNAEPIGTRAPRLLLSFWDLCLDNLPVGRFERRRVLTAEARDLVGGARARGRLLCVSSKDLLAPYGVKHLRRYKELCALLSSQFDIGLGVKDFTSAVSEQPAQRFINR